MVLSEGVIEGADSNTSFLSKAVYFVDLCTFVTDGNPHTRSYNKTNEMYQFLKLLSG